MGMRKLAAIALALGLMTAPALGAPVPVDVTTDAPMATDATIVSGGGTPVSNGVFFPGTAIVGDDGKLQGLPPVEIRKGFDFDFVNIDEAAVSNAHKIISIKRRKGEPLFQSDVLQRPGDTDLVITSHLKPGVYGYFCAFHSTMYGRIKIVGG